MAGEEGTTRNGKDYSKRKGMDVKMLVEAEDRRKNVRTKALLEKRSEKTNEYIVSEK